MSGLINTEQSGTVGLGTLFPGITVAPSSCRGERACFYTETVPLRLDVPDAVATSTPYFLL